jgi:hypothetical protein
MEPAEMNKSNLWQSSIFLMTCLLANVTLVPNAVAWMSNTEPTQKQSGNDEETFIFAGRCADGSAYRLYSFQMDVDGLRQSFYDYEGPAGKSTVRTNTSPKKMALLVCHELADIADSSMYDGGDEQ